MHTAREALYSMCDMYLVASILQRLKKDKQIFHRSTRKILCFQGIFAQSFLHSHFCTVIFIFLIKMSNISANNVKGLTPEGHFPAQNKIREGGKRRDMQQPQENKDSPLDWHMVGCLKQMW